ncbi:uncharacterized protein KGF55_003295 [Candida pseudojiufengensis]|uniref:uncharacterized protein n=1 Tax=Candida pseudojiufengensis TaxID=497109 RepID=UPI0022256CE8|nr:uncharacterized protein KGF55_003295 [Candida pseudojiufengensis]KAI5962219.1 hypothetical protein KGF55_003295 [Candida pseudojiufengensis]
MSIADLSREVDNLAKIIINKNTELEQLKRGYDLKIKTINDYIAKFQAESKDKERISDEHFHKLLQNKVECPKCGSNLNDGEEEFILIPKSQIPYLLPESQTQNKPIVPTKIQPNLSSTPSHESKSKKKTHIICSFCKESGHTRARCHKKLGIQPS